MSVVTLLTVQNTQKLSRVMTLPSEFVLEQLSAVLQDITPAAAKTGALGSSEIIEAVANEARRFSFPLVVDPVMISKHGAPLLDEDAWKTLASKLLPHTFVVTPNLHEASALAQRKVEGEDSIRDAARAIHDLGPKAVLIKGGHAQGDASDFLYYKGEFHILSSARVKTSNTHGTGCTFSAALTAELAKGVNLVKAAGTAKKFIAKAIETNPGIGKGSGPVNHWVDV